MFTAEQIQKLNELEMQVYQYVMQHKSAVPYMRIRELAAESYVSPTTVMRFCKKMGCDGYNEFKWRVKHEVGQRKTASLPDDAKEIRAFLEELETGRYESKLERAASMIAKAERILLVGVGNSGSIGQYGARCFTNMGKFSMFISDPFYPINLLQTTSTLAIVLSVSGETREMVDMVNRLKAADCAVISITNKESCTISKLLDWNISYRISVHREEQAIDFSTQVPAVCLLEVLGRKVRNRLSEE